MVVTRRIRSVTSMLSHRITKSFSLENKFNFTVYFTLNAWEFCTTMNYFEIWPKFSQWFWSEKSFRSSWKKQVVKRFFPFTQEFIGALPPKVESLLSAWLNIRQVKVKLFGAEGNRYFVDIFPTKEVKRIIWCMPNIFGGFLRAQHCGL